MRLKYSSMTTWSRRLTILLLTIIGVSTRWHTRLHSTRVRFGLRGLVQIHHVYPRQFRNHPALRGIVDIDTERNLVLMPTYEGVSRMHLRPDRLVHDGGHPAYNRYVGRLLDRMLALPPDERRRIVAQTLCELRRDVRHPPEDLPWL